MKYKTKATLFIGALILAGSSFAAQNVTCPSLDAIKSEMLTISENFFDQFYFTYNASSYGTDVEWFFGIVPVEADSIENSLSIANDVLTNMNAQGIPRKSNNIVVCTYDTNRPNLISAAVQADTIPMPRMLMEYAHNAY